MSNYGARSPRHSYTPAPLKMKPNNTGIIIGAVLAVIALICVILLFTVAGRGDSGPQITLAPFGATTTVAAAASTIPNPAITRVSDDTGTFSINIRGDLQRESAPSIAAGGFIVPRITASVNLPAYYADNTTFGVLVVAVGPDIGSEVAQVLGFLEPNEAVCKERLRETINTTYGQAVRISLTGCGIDNLGTKVLLSVQLVEPPLVVGLRMQDEGELTAIQSAALYILETMQFG